MDLLIILYLTHAVAFGLGYIARSIVHANH